MQEMKVTLFLQAFAVIVQGELKISMKGGNFKFAKIQIGH